MVNKAQVAVAVIASGTFWLVFLGVYPVGFLTRSPQQVMPLNVTYSGLDEQYRVGDALKFSIKYEGAWYSNQDYAIIIKQIDNANGNRVDKTIWTSTEMEDISEGPPEQPITIEYIVEVGANPSHPLTLKEVGLYVIIAGGENVPNGEKYFSVIEAHGNLAE